MMRAVVAALLSCVLTTGCVSRSEIGPYVKSVARNGPWLEVQRCTIVLVENTLEEGACSVDHLPLASVPTVPANAPAPASAAPPPQALP